MPQDNDKDDSDKDDIPFWRRKSLAQMTKAGVGKPLRRLRPLLPQQARGGGHRQDLLHRRRLPPARRRGLPLPRLPAPARQGQRLRPPHPQKPRPHLLAAAVLRLRPRRRGQGPLLVAPARLRRPRHRPHRRRLRARPRRRQREGRARRGARGAHRQLAPEAAEGRAAEEKAVARERLSSRPARQRGEGGPPEGRWEGQRPRSFCRPPGYGTAARPLHRASRGPPPPLRFTTRGRTSAIVLAARFLVAPEFCRTKQANKQRPSPIFVRRRRWWNRPPSRSGADSSPD